MVPTTSVKMFIEVVPLFGCEVNSQIKQPYMINWSLSFTLKHLEAIDEQAKFTCKVGVCFSFFTPKKEKNSNSREFSTNPKSHRSSFATMVDPIWNFLPQHHYVYVLHLLKCLLIKMRHENTYFNVSCCKWLNTHLGPQTMGYG